MLDHYLKQTTAENSRFGPLKPHVAAFSATLAEAGYARISVEIRLRLLSHLGRWMQRTRRPVADLCQDALETFLRAYRRRLQLKASDRCTLRRFIEHLQHQGVIAVPTVGPEHKEPFMEVERRYEDHLLKERGLTAATVERYTWFVHRFLLSRFDQGQFSLKKLQASDVSNFVVQNAHCTGPKRAHLMVSALRSFFRFLTQEGEMQTDLAGLYHRFLAAHWRVSPNTSARVRWKKSWQAAIAARPSVAAITRFFCSLPAWDYVPARWRDCSSET